MTGEAHWFVLIPLLLGALGIALLLWSDIRAEHRYHTEERRFLCPGLRRKVIALLVRDPKSRRVIGVRRCTGSPNPDLVTCSKSCVSGFGPRSDAIPAPK